MSVAIQQVLPFGTASVDAPPPAQAERASRTGLRLHYSNRTENLLQSLIENLEAAKLRDGASLFDAATVVVPNRQIETYLRFGIARATGIASSLEMPFLRAYLEERVAHWQVPERWALIDAVPKTSVGKFDKKVLRQRYADGELDVTTLG